MRTRGKLWYEIDGEQCNIRTDYSKKQLVGVVFSSEDAEFICKAVNNHERLVSLLQIIANNRTAHPADYARELLKELEG